MFNIHIRIDILINIHIHTGDNKGINVHIRIDIHININLNIGIDISNFINNTIIRMRVVSIICNHIRINIDIIVSASTNIRIKY